MYFGQPVERVEDLRLLRGRGTYVDDVTPQGLVHAAVLRSSVAHGIIRRIDVAAAKTLPGVVAVFTGRDFESLPQIPLRLAPMPGVTRFLQRPIATDKVRFVGEPIALVIARSREIAEDAVDLIGLDIEPLAAVVDW